MLPTFRWTTFDVTGMLPPLWQQDAIEAAAAAEVRDFARTPVISREAPDVEHVTRGRFHADQVTQRLPWLPQLYRSGFRSLAEEVVGESVAAARDSRYGAVLNVQRGRGMRFECHIDSNPLTGVLFFSDHEAGGGGELIFAHDQAASSMAEIDRSCSMIRSHAGHLIFFDGRRNPHYVRPLAQDEDTRVVAVMNYYLSSFPESTRPAELNRHLYGDR
jgi:hypothetical protein